MNGRWLPANGFEMLAKLKDQIGDLPLIAEDLGVITREVEKLRDAFGLPGMKVLQFAFLSDSTNTNLPHNFSKNFVVYTGTHDNNTTLGWLKNVQGEERKMVKKYVRRTNRAGLKKTIGMAWSSIARTAVLPMQDFLMLGEKARMNTPGTATDNWEWRFQWNQVKSKYKKNLTELTQKYNR
jgi:4-alpha-glucanotransferase